MSSIINLVQGDTGPQIRATLTRSDTGDAVDVSGATVRLNFRAHNATDKLFSMNNLAGNAAGADGICIFSFTAGNLDLPAGDYQGEIEVIFEDASRETIYELIEFNLREDIS